MTGLFAEWQPRYAELGIPTFPVKDKKPAVTGYARMGLSRSEKLVTRFGDADSFGISCSRNRFTVLDFDSSNETEFEAALIEFGPTPLIVRTGSGHFHGWYRNNGERRRIRLEARPIDILGGGYVIAPHSRGYEIIEGSLADLRRLPTMKRSICDLTAGSSSRPTGHRSTDDCPSGERIRTGERNDALFRACLRQIRTGGTKADLMRWAAEFSASSFDAALPEDEMARLVQSAFKLNERGDNWVGAGRRVVLPDVAEKLLPASPDAVVLLYALKLHNWGGKPFIAANGMAPMVGLSEPRFVAARKRLVDIGILEMIRPPSPRNGPALYRFKTP